MQSVFRNIEIVAIISDDWHRAMLAQLIKKGSPKEACIFSHYRYQLNRLQCALENRKRCHHGASSQEAYIVRHSAWFF